MKKLLDLLKILLGLAMVGFAISVFYVPNKVVSGGVSGLSTILYHTVGIPVSLGVAAFNIILSVIGIKILGKKFILKSLIGSLLLSVFVEVFSYIPSLTENPVLATVFGGIMYGVGIGITFSMQTSSGGTDIVARIFQHFYPQISIGKLLMVVDGLVILTSLIVFKDTELILLGISALAICSFTVDFHIRSKNISKLVFVISDKGEEIARELISSSPRGVTLLDVKGAYTNEKKSMLVCALKEWELTGFQSRIENIDPFAFTIFTESSQIVGKGFHVYK